jgi:hypothetical protein
MLQEVIRKLRDELIQPITSERQVVYLLVELRKLIDLNGDAEKFFALNFYCDWAVHPMMDRKGAARIVERVDEYQGFLERMKNAKDGEYLGADLNFLGPLRETLRLERFREQFGEYTRACVLGYDIAATDGWWTKDSGLAFDVSTSAVPEPSGSAMVLFLLAGVSLVGKCVHRQVITYKKNIPARSA